MLKPTLSERTHPFTLEVRNLCVKYGQKKAVDDVNFSIERGEIFGLLGPNGAGKTSTLSAIEGLIKPYSGTALIDGIDIQKYSAEAKAKLGVHFQTTNFQYELTINQVITLFAGLYNVELSSDDVMESLVIIGLEGEAGKLYRQLSGGQQQRLSLFISNMHNPSLLVLDEPSTGLDPQSRRMLWDHLSHNRERGGSILLTTHSMEEVQAVCDRVAIIKHGKIIAIDTPTELIKKYSDDPSVRKLARGKVTLEDVFISMTGNEVRE